MIYALNELDDLARYLAVHWQPAAERPFSADCMAKLKATKRQFKTGRYGRDWPFQRWLMERVGLDHFTVRSLATDLEDADDDELEAS